jgi:retinol dehydrogenase-12
MSKTERSLLSRFLSSQFKTLPYPVQSFRDLVVIVTGANTGLGLEASRHFVRLGAAKVILAVRDVEKGKAAQDSISLSTETKNRTEVWSLDLASYESVKEFAQRAAGLDRLDVFVANGGLCTETFELAEGMEKSFLVNVVSTFLLVFLLLPQLRKTATEFQTRPHVVIVSSEGHETATFDEGKSESILAALNDQSTSNMGDR